MIFIFFFLNFVTPQKRNMSERCWLFTLKMAVQSLSNRDFPFRRFQPNVNTSKKHESSISQARRQKRKKNKGTLFSATSKV